MAKKGRAEAPPAASPAGPSSSAPPELGPFAADCANAGLKEEVKKLYAAMQKKMAAKEGGKCIKGVGGWGGLPHAWGYCRRVDATLQTLLLQAAAD